jgi:hypothetical protein
MGIVDVKEDVILRFRSSGEFVGWLGSIVVQATIKAYLGCRVANPSKDECYFSVLTALAGFVNLLIKVSLDAVHESDNYDSELDHNVVPVVEYQALNKLVELGIVDKAKLDKLIEAEDRQ